jgi:predicted DNA-binding protein (MmcQ/YjbR family)
VGLRLDTRKVDWDEVAEIVATSYRLIAPKRLAALVG